MNQIVEYRKDDFYITTDFSKIDVNVVCTLLEKSYWANSRKRDIIIRSLENSLCFSLFHKNKQIGLMRVITDYTIFAYLCDVIIDEEYRRNGLGKWFLECVLRHPELINIRKWCLATKDAHDFYRKFGFNTISEPKKYMEKFNDLV